MSWRAALAGVALLAGCGPHREAPSDPTTDALRSSFHQTFGATLPRVRDRFESGPGGSFWVVTLRPAAEGRYVVRHEFRQAAGPQRSIEEFHFGVAPKGVSRLHHWSPEQMGPYPALTLADTCTIALTASPHVDDHRFSTEGSSPTLSRVLEDGDRRLSEAKDVATFDFQLRGEGLPELAILAAQGSAMRHRGSRGITYEGTGLVRADQPGQFNLVTDLEEIPLRIVPRDVGVDVLLTTLQRTDVTGPPETRSTGALHFRSPSLTLREGDRLRVRSFRFTKDVEVQAAPPPVYPDATLRRAAYRAPEVSLQAR